MDRVRDAVARRHGTAQVLIAVAAVQLYELLRHLIRPDWPAAIQHARDVFALEQVAHLDIEGAVQRLALHVPLVVAALGLFYLMAHWVVTAAFLVWLYRRSRPAFLLFRDAMLLATAFALVVHVMFPAAPPRLAGLGIEDTVRTFLRFDVGSPRSAPFSDPVAALPSLHAGWAVAVGIGVVLYARSRVTRMAGALYPLLVVIATIATGNHFVLDAVAGALVMGFGLAAAGALRRGSRPAVS